jgi:hypothetical protein
VATHDGDAGWRDDIVFDDDFINDAPVREGGPLPKPSRESLREVRREAKERQRAARRPPKPPKPPKLPRSRGQGRARVWFAIIPALLLVVAAYVHFGVNQNPAGSLATGASKTVGDVWVNHSASRWATASEGIEVPVARAQGRFSGDDVKAALIASREFVEAATVNRTVLFQEQVDPVLKTLADGAEISTYYGSPRTSKSWPYLITRFPKEAVRAADSTIRYRGSMKPALRDGMLVVDFSYATAYALEGAQGDSTPEIVVVRREGTLEFEGAQPGQVGLPSAGRMYHVSDHSVCGSRWPFKAFTEVWIGRQPKPDNQPTASDQPTLDPNERHDLNNPDDSIKEIDSCFTNTSSDQ